MVCLICYWPGKLGPPRRWQTRFRRPHPVIPRQVAPQQSLLLFHWTKSERCPFPFPLGSIGRETGNESVELVAPCVMDDFAFGGEFGQGGADLGGADATEFLQLLNRDWFLELSQSLAHPLRCGGRSLRLNRGAFHDLQGHDGA
jgi:hypothetical protein